MTFFIKFLLVSCYKVNGDMSQIVRVYLNVNWWESGGIHYSKSKGASRNCTKWKTSISTGEWKQGNEVKKKTNKHTRWLLQGDFPLWNATVYQADQLVLIKGFQSDWFRMPFLGKPKLSLFGDMALSTSDSILGRRLFIQPVAPAPPNWAQCLACGRSSVNDGRSGRWMYGS